MFASLSGALAGVTEVEEAGAAFDAGGAAIAPDVALGVLSDFLQPIAATRITLARNADAWSLEFIIGASLDVGRMRATWRADSRDRRRVAFAHSTNSTVFRALFIPQNTVLYRRRPASSRSS